MAITVVIQGKVLGRSRVNYVPITATVMPYDIVFSNTTLISLMCGYGRWPNPGSKPIASEVVSLIDAILVPLV